MRNLKDMRGMTRFEAELKGEFGAFWQSEAYHKIFDVQQQYCKGELVITDDGVAYWACNGNAVMDDLAEIIEHTWFADKFSRENTRIVRNTQNAFSIAQYKKRMENHVYSDEELFEMRSAFGDGATIVDCITGKEIQL